jgi:hypothetical protein
MVSSRSMPTPTLCCVAAVLCLISIVSTTVAAVPSFTGSLILTIGESNSYSKDQSYISVDPNTGHYHVVSHVADVFQGTTTTN